MPDVALATIVVPTIGRPSLRGLLDALGTGPEPIVLVDDRRQRTEPLLTPVPPGIVVVASGGRGPAAARNAGWRLARTEWVAFVDDDVLPDPGWREALAADLNAAPPDVAAVQGRIRVPLPTDRRPTDWERDVAGLERSRWITADLAYRRSVLATVGGFDERFPRAYREDADLALRVRRAGHRLVMGERTAQHPPGSADRWVSVRRQAGNAADPLMRALHGPRWREEAEAPPGRRPRHLATTAALACAGIALAAGRPKAAAAAAAAWLAGTAELAAARIAPGPRTADEVATMLATSAAIPIAATYHWLRGIATLPSTLRRPGPAPSPPSRPAAVLLDRDGTLVVDVPYNGDPSRVEPMPGARRALDRLRAAGIPTAVVSNQSGIARGLLTREQVDAVNRRVDELLGPLGPWLVCPHGPDDGCGCRKPSPGMVVDAARRLGVDPSQVVVIGDIGADIEAARAAGARAVLVPTGATRAEEVASAPVVAADIETAVEVALAGAAA